MADIYKTTAGLNVDDARSIKINYLTFGATNFGYMSGGTTNPEGVTSSSNVIERFPFSVATANATDVGDLTNTITAIAGQSSATHGYISAGIYQTPTPTYSNVIERFPFAVSTTNGSDVGDLTVARNAAAGQSSVTHGYTSGGIFISPLSVVTIYNVIDRFPFADATVNATDVGDLSLARSRGAGSSSTTHGYIASGESVPSPTSNNIERFPFASATTNGTSVGNLGYARSKTTGLSSMTHGYTTGDWDPFDAPFNNYERFPFASTTTNASTVGLLTVLRNYVTGQSSVDYGYTSGGNAGTQSNVIDRFPFAVATTSSTDVGDLTVARARGAGQQY